MLEPENDSTSMVQLISLISIPIGRLDRISRMINKCTWPRRSNYVQFYIKVVDETIISWCLINQIFLIYRSPY